MKSSYVELLVDIAVSYSLDPAISLVRRAGELSIRLVCADVGPARSIQNAENDLDGDVACAIVRDVIVVGPAVFSDPLNSTRI